MLFHLKNSSFGLAFGALALALCFAVCPAPLHAQVPAPPPAGFPTGPDMTPTTPNNDPGLRHMLHKMAKERNTDRQKKIEADTARLLELAKQLHAAVVKSNKNTLSIDVVKDAEEIEKLAKSIKDKMRDGQ
jgi:hypothetical protein